MRPIPPKLRKDLEKDPYYKLCCITGARDVQWHHNLIFAGRQVNERWCILPLSEKIHDLARNKEVKEILDWIMINRATEEQLKIYSKAVDYVIMKETLNKKYGRYTPDRFVLSGPRKSIIKQILFRNSLGS